MQHSKKTALVSTTVAALMALSAGTAMASRGGGGGGDDGDGDGERVTLCHMDGQGRWHQITVDDNAVDTHLANGDVRPDENGNCPADEDDGDDDGDGGGQDDGQVRRASCDASQDNSSHNSTGNVTQSGLINIGGIALQGDNVGALNNVLCRGDVANGLLVNVLGTVLGGGHGGGLLSGLLGGILGDGDSDSRGGGGGCDASQDNDSTNQTGDIYMSGLINLGGIALQGTNLGVLDNLLCGGNVLNNLTASILGGALGLF